MPYHFKDQKTLKDKAEWISYKSIRAARDVRSYVRNRLITRSHIIRTELKPGQWHETEDQILYGAFAAFCDYVEVQCAWMGTWGDDNFKSPWFKRFRSREYAEKRFDWECNLRWSVDEGFAPDDPCVGQLTLQAISARKQRELYHWWRDKRPSRPDSYHAEGDAKAWELFLEYLGDTPIPEDLVKEYTVSGRGSPKRLTILVIDAYYTREDSEKLKELIDIRTHLWT